MLPTPRALLAAAFIVSLVASIWSLSLSGIGPLGWRGAGLFPCELCWYQRIMMYPLPVLLAVALARRDHRAALYALPLSVPGFLVAGFHIIVQANPSWEPAQCYVGSCTVVERTWPGLTIPQMSILAFGLVIILCAASLTAQSKSESL